MIVLSFTPEQLAIIDQALSHRPYGEVAALVNDINRQIAEAQQKEATDAT